MQYEHTHTCMRVHTDTPTQVIHKHHQAMPGRVAGRREIKGEVATRESDNRRCRLDPRQ